VTGGPGQPVALVTGAGRGIGREIALTLAREGCHVAVAARSSDQVHATAAAVANLGVQTVPLVLDVTDAGAVMRGVASIAASLGPVDVLVNNAGIGESSPLAQVTLADWRRHLDVNATAPFLCTRAVLPGMLDRNSGRIVTVASTAGRAGTRFTAAYTASKHAAIGLMRAVAAEVGGTGVTANAVCPAFVRTDLTDRAVARIVERTGRTAEDAELALASLSPLRRLLEPEEVADAVWYLASPAAAAVNGQALVVDGGGVQA
jgi:NAD(P)-dependent dehydrogenase (short-subunit alcohol dehydrogenase family)